MGLRRFNRSADRYRIAEIVGLMYRQIQAVHTVATMNTWHPKFVCTAYANGIDIRGIFMFFLVIPLVRPCVRQLTVSNSNMFDCRQDARTLIELQRDDTVATVRRIDRIHVFARLVEEPFLRVSMRMELILFFVTDCSEEQGILYHGVVNYQIIDTVAALMRLQLLDEVTSDGVFVDLNREFLTVTRFCPYMGMSLVLRRTEVNRIHVVVHRIHDQMQGVDVLTMFA